MRKWSNGGQKHYATAIHEKPGRSRVLVDVVARQFADELLLVRFSSRCAMHLQAKSLLCATCTYPRESEVMVDGAYLQLMIRMHS